MNEFLKGVGRFFIFSAGGFTGIFLVAFDLDKLELVNDPASYTFHQKGVSYSLVEIKPILPNQNPAQR